MRIHKAADKRIRQKTRSDGIASSSPRFKPSRPYQKLFQSKIISDQFYKPRDTYWNIAGNQMAANIIHEHIRKYLAF